MSSSIRGYSKDPGRWERHGARFSNGCRAMWRGFQATERHSEVLGELLAFIGMQANLVPDAHLAALALEHGLTLCSADADFARFPGLRWTNPLAQ